MRQRALIDINVLLDTRLGVLGRMNAKAAGMVAHSDWYFIRETDDWAKVTEGTFNNEEFKTIYDRMEVETLAGSMMTDFVYFFRKEVSDVLPELDIRGLDDDIEFDINVYPYKLLASEKEIIRRSVSRYISTPATVKIVDTAYHLLSPKVLDAKYDMMTIYNYEDWLKYHHEALLTQPIPEFTIFHPRIAPSGNTPEPDETFRDPFMVVPMVLMPYVQIHPVDTKLTCWSRKLYLSSVSPQK